MTPDAAPEPMLTGVIEMDETYVGWEGAEALSGRTAGRAAGYRGPEQQDAAPEHPEDAGRRRAGAWWAGPGVGHAGRDGEEREGDVAGGGVNLQARLMTDESGLYTKVGRPFADHQAVKYSMWSMSGATRTPTRWNRSSPG